MPAPCADVDWDADRDWELPHGRRRHPEWLLAALRRRRARGAGRSYAAAESLDQRVGGRPSRDRTSHFTLRWILLHMIEETARHNGHVDLLARPSTASPASSAQLLDGVERAGQLDALSVIPPAAWSTMSITTLFHELRPVGVVIELVEPPGRPRS